MRGEVGAELRAQRLDARLALGAPLVEQRARWRGSCSGSRKRNARSSSSHLICQMPSRLASGANTCSDSAASSRRARRLAGREVAQRLQARGQAQQHDAQVAREREQHLAHALGLQRARRPRRRARPARARCSCAELARVRDEAACDAPNSRRHHLVGLAELVARVDEVGGGAASTARRRSRAGSRRRRRRGRARPRRSAARGRRAAARRRRARARPRRRRRGRRRRARRARRTIGAVGRRAAAGAVFTVAFTGAAAGTPARRRPGPAHERRRMADAGELVQPRAGRAASSPARSSRDSRSDSAPRSSSVGQRIAS